jgi:hypothetical protein
VGGLIENPSQIKAIWSPHLAEMRLGNHPLTTGQLNALAVSSTASLLISNEEKLKVVLKMSKLAILIKNGSKLGYAELGKVW